MLFSSRLIKYSTLQSNSRGSCFARGGSSPSLSSQFCEQVSYENAEKNSQAFWKAKCCLAPSFMTPPPDLLSSWKSGHGSLLCAYRMGIVCWWIRKRNWRKIAAAHLAIVVVTCLQDRLDETKEKLKSYCLQKWSLMFSRKEQSLLASTLMLTLCHNG